ncbi:MAG: DUF2948 family protein [Alphaproteobacteria bacterium]|nr:DUF2948 family protein [Alphaproteobacteria bacterium]
MTGNGRTAGRLRLRAVDTDDLQVISGCLQDALTCVGDLSFQPKQRRFVLLVSRFMWERRPPAPAAGERVRAGLRFRHVAKVQALGIDLADRRGLLVLLAIEARPREAGLDIVLNFAGGGTIRLSAECVDCELADLGEPWTTPHRPRHDEAPGQGHDTEPSR